MLARLKRFVAPPVFPDEDQTRTAALLTTILLVAFVIITGYIVIQIIVTGVYTGLEVAALFALAQVVLWVLLRRGAIRLVSFLFCGVAFVGLALFTYELGGVGSSSYSALILAVVIASILLGWQVALGMALLSVGVGWLLMKAGPAGLIPGVAFFTPFDAWLGQSLVFFLAAVLLGLTDRSLRHALQAARVNESALQRRTLELEQERSALRVSEERYRNFIEQSMEGILRLEFDQPIPIDLPPLEQVRLIHHTGHIAECNQALAKMYGYPARRDILGKRLIDLYGGSASEENIKYMLALIKSGYHTSNRETVEISRQGERLYFLNNAVGVIQAKRLTAIWGTQLDVTERKLIEQLLARRARHMQTAADVSRAVASILDLDELLPRIVDLLQAGFDLYYAGLFLINESGRRADLRAATGDAGRQMLQAEHQLLIDDQSMIGWCMLHRQARLALDVGEDPVHFDNPLLPATRSEMALPLVKWGRVIGALTIQSVRPRDFTTDDAAVLQTMADQVAIAIDNARLFEAEKRNAALMTALRDLGLDLSAQLELAALLRTIVMRAARLLGAPMGNLFLLQPDGHTLEEMASYPSPLGERGMTLQWGEGVSGHVAATGEPLIVDDYQIWPDHIQTAETAEYRAVLGVPIKWQGRVLGVINLQESRPAVFAEEHAARLQLFAAQAAVAIENARLFEAVWRRVNELNVLHEVAVAATRAGDEQELIARTMEVIGSALNIDYVGVLLKDEAVHGLRIDTYVSGMHMLRADQIIPLGQGVTGTVALTGQARRIDDVRRAPEYYQYNSDALSELCMPLKVGDHILGVINAESRQLAAFSEADEQLLSTVAGQLGTALDRLRTEAARRQNEEELAQERNLLRTLIDNLSDTHVFVKDTHSRFLTTNAEHLRMMGLTAPEQVVGKTDFDFFDRAEAERYYADEQAAMLTGEPLLDHVEEVRDSSGKLRWYLTNKMPLRDKDGKIIGLVGSSVNITERQRAAEREQAIARGLQAVVEAADELLQIDDLDLFYRRAVELAREKLNVERCGIFLLDAERQFLLGTYGTNLQGETTDERGVKLLLADQPELFGHGLRRLVVPATQQGYWDRGVFQATATGWIALTVIGSSAEPIGVLSNDAGISQALIDEVQQEALAIYCSLIGNVIVRKRVAQERETLINELEAKNAELERFTYTVSHDLKSPLITIRGFMGLLTKDTAAGDLDRMRSDLERIGQATDKMQRLLNELLELSRVGRLTNAPERVPLDSIVREAVALVEGRLSARGVQVDIAPDLPEVFVDRPRLVEVLQNLIDNAAKFMGDQVEPRIEIGLRDEATRRVLFVRDNGLGIEPRFHDKVFGLFDKLDPKSEGTGIGLALVKRIIEVHGGHVWVESAGLGQGATFCFTLPAPA